MVLVNGWRCFNKAYLGVRLFLIIFCSFFHQTERAYQKQPTIFQNKKRVLVAAGGKEGKEKLPRYHKSVGLGFKTPREVNKKSRNCFKLIKTTERFKLINCK